MIKPKSKHIPDPIQCFTHEQVKKINKEIKKNIAQKQDPSFAAYNVSKIGDFFHVPCNPLTKLLRPWLYQCQLVNRESFGFDIYWDFHLEVLNYNVYGIGDEYSWHIDSNTENSPRDMKLTCLLNLSEEPYEGGKFYVITSKKEIEFVSGMGVVFHSLIAHKVTPVTKGERITLTYWGTGPSMK